MSKKNLRPSIEALESRIAPAAVAALPTIKDAELAWDKNQFNDTHFVTAVTNTPLFLHAGQILTTGSGARAGQYLMFVQKGTAEVFTTDLNNNGQIDYNEITGVAAGDGLRLISFVDIHGDIVTNLDADNTLSDSDNNAANNPVTHGDGRILNNSRIEAITMRSLTLSEITSQDGAPATLTDQQSRLAFTSYSIFGEILAGKGFGVEGDATSGLHIDATGTAVQKLTFIGVSQSVPTFYVDVKPTVGPIRTGTAASGEYFSFGYSSNDDIEGTIVTFTPPSGQVGGDVFNVSSTAPYNFSGVYTGDGGLGARGGNIANITLNGDDTGGYNLVAGNGGRAATGGAGGSIVNFTDIGSVTGQVNLVTGDGGQGTNGVGGSGGTLGFGSSIVQTSAGITEVANLNVNAGLSINLGDGGTGFRGGGAGASLTNLILRSPDSIGAIGVAVVGTTHDHAHDPTTGLLTGPAVIGNANSFDFDNDGINDLVYTSLQPSQLFVAFGDGAGGFTSPTSLDGPSGIQAATVADVNGDGHPDVIVGSAQAGDFSGLTVFLSKYSNNNGVAQFKGFSSGIISPLPSLNSGDPDSPFTYYFGYSPSSNPITSVTAGDFNGDGHTDIALTAAYIFGGIDQLLMYMTPDVEDGVSSGHFYADFGTKALNGQLAQSFLPFVDLGSSPNAKVLATALNTTSAYDVVTTLLTDGTLTLNGITGISYAGSPGPSPTDHLSVYDFHQKQFGPVQLSDILFDKVDTNRNLAQVTPVQASLRDFAIIDFNGDQKADFFAVTDTPAGFIVGVQGDGVGNGGVPALINPGSPADNSGYSTQPLAEGTPLSIRGSIPNAQGSMSGVAVLFSSFPDIVTFDFTPYVPVGTVVVNPGVNKTFVSPGGPSGGQSLQAFDTFIVSDADRSFYDYAFAAGGIVTSFGDSSSGSSGGNEGFQGPLSEQFVIITAGDGGVGQIGRGGNGGIIGNGTLKDNPANFRLEGSIDYTLPAIGTIAVELFGGTGGDGFSFGGTGGSVSGVAVRFNPDVTGPNGTGFITGFVHLTGGDGGSGNSGAGGAGGSISKSTTVAGGVPIILKGGQGGDGLSGGAGGSVTGHGFKTYADAYALRQVIVAGSGGDGIRSGGIGGSVRDFHGDFSILGGDGYLTATAGDGGSGSAGPGGAGGDIVKLSPTTPSNSANGNLLAGDIFMQAGNGGEGTIGGRGGSVSDFANKQSGANPGLLVFIAGNGGDGTRGNGGVGGSVSALSVSSLGTHKPGDKVLSGFSYNHIIAGNGGDSANAAGGAGGSVLNINTTASDNTYAVAAGAGGNGLLAGGLGGSVKTLALAVGGKGLVVAGNGGDAGGFLGDGGPMPSGFGGKIGKGGNGGSIVNFVQLGASAVHVDLIAGNGGDSVNFGSLNNLTEGVKYVGTGGSIVGVTAQGSLGNTKDPTVAIKSYNDILLGETMADFVDRVLRTPTDAVLVDDAHGNVGVVVGASGRLSSNFFGYDANGKAIFKSIAAFGGINGDLLNLRAGAVLAAVAGNVERVAPIRTVSNLSLYDPNHPERTQLHIGFDKVDSNGLIDNSNPEYRSGDPDGLVVDPVSHLRVIPHRPVIEGRLVDGAILATVFLSTSFTGDSHFFTTAEASQ
jgi:hypothetical protein